MDSTSDRALMQKVRDGDLDKLGLLFERYNRRLFGFFYRLTARRDISEDLVQNVFERILKYRKSYTANGNFSTWIFQIARNLHADHYHKAKKMNEEEEPTDWDQFPGEFEEPTFESDKDREQRIMQQALNQLDPIKKQTLVLSRFEGFKYKEIAEIMDCTESAVKVRVFRGINELKEIITELRKQEKL